MTTRPLTQSMKENYGCRMGFTGGHPFGCLQFFNRHSNSELSVLHFSCAVAFTAYEWKRTAELIVAMCLNCTSYQLHVNNKNSGSDTMCTTNFRRKYMTTAAILVTTAFASSHKHLMTKSTKCLYSWKIASIITIGLVRSRDKGKLPRAAKAMNRMRMHTRMTLLNRRKRCGMPHDAL